jgi:hypothetical protein
VYLIVWIWDLLKIWLSIEEKPAENERREENESPGKKAGQIDVKYLRMTNLNDTSLLSHFVSV